MIEQIETPTLRLDDPVIHEHLRSIQPSHQYWKYVITELCRRPIAVLLKVDATGARETECFPVD